MSGRFRRILALLLCTSLLAGCSGTSTETTKKKKKVKKTTKETPTETVEPGYDVTPEPLDPSTTPTVTPTTRPTPSPGGITDLTMFISMAGREINDGNEIQEEIAKLTGVRLKETYLSGVSADEAIGNMISRGDFPDLINAGYMSQTLYQSDYLIAWDDYLADPQYSNPREMFTDKEWELFRQDDGHIYWADVFKNTYGEDQTKLYKDGLAFWIQVRVLEWAGYPKIETLDEYFDLLERFYAENQYNSDGKEIIPYSCITEGWRYFSLESAPQCLGGYYFDGSVIVNTEDYDKPTVEDLNTTETAKAYFRKLNEMYAKGLIDKDFASQDYDTYIQKINSGCVLGLCDEWWDFAYNAHNTFVENRTIDLGYEYVPLALTIEKGMPNHYYAYKDTINNASGVAVTTNCIDPDLVFTFLNRCLDQDILNLRFWGIEGEDYLVDDSGLFYRTEEMRNYWSNTTYQADHVCRYDYLPQYDGTSRDGINAMKPEQQAYEFLSTLSDPLVRCFDAYGYTSYLDFLGSEKEEAGEWFPLYSYSNNLDLTSPEGVAFYAIGECKHEWLPIVVLSSDFDSVWDEYMEAYAECNPEVFLAGMQEELDRRVANG